jgi:hypothetical protein
MELIKKEDIVSVLSDYYDAGCENKEIPEQLKSKGQVKEGGCLF